MQPSHYQQIGGEPKVRELVDRFYQLMDELPEAHDIRKLHPRDLTASREKLFKFLSGWLGGPPLYVNEYGHPRLRMRHMPFAIGKRERDQWMMCMRQALEDIGVEKMLRLQLEQAFYKVADFMRNQNEDGDLPKMM